MELTWYGHASLRIITRGGVIIYVDPYAGEQSWYDKKADIVLITHDDYDHLNEGILHAIISDTTVVLSTPAVRSRHHEVKPVWPGEKHSIRGIGITVVHAYNTSKGGHAKGEGVGYLLEFDGTSVYIAGDTDFIPEMRAFRAETVVLPVGGTYTMGPRQAAEVVLGMKPKNAIPYHWGKIVGTLDDAELFREMVETAGVTSVHVLHPHQSVEL